MTPPQLLGRRLRNQQLTEHDFRKPEEVVSWMAAMQAQEYPMAKWAIGLRLPGSTEATVEKALNAGKILRTHVLRPTWHFVTPRDIRWMIELTAPRIRRIMAPYDKKLGLDRKIYNRSNDALGKALEDKPYLLRTEIREILAQKKVPIAENRVSHILMSAELDCVLVSGPRVGKQQTYALFDKRAPRAKSLPHEEALAQLAKRYFATRGPATVHDFSWWSGLTVGEARRGIEMLSTKFRQEEIGGKTFIYAKDELPDAPLRTFLLPDYDEYGIAYKDRSMLNPHKLIGELRGGDTVFNHMIMIDGVFGGTWRPHTGKRAGVEVHLQIPLSQTKKNALDRAVDQYKKFWSI